MPIGEPILYQGKYVEDNVYPLYIQMISCAFELKKDKIPTIQIKHSRFVDNEYITDSGIEPVALTLTSIDLKLFLEQYDIEYIKHQSLRVDLEIILKTVVVVLTHKGAR